MAVSLSRMVLACAGLAGALAIGPVHAARAAPANERDRACLAGAYEGGATEIAAGLYLHGDGRYDFALSMARSTRNRLANGRPIATPST